MRVWDKDHNPSNWSEAAGWTMGLLEPGDWQAQWIGVPPELPAPRAPASNETLSVTKATYRTLDGSVAVDVTEIMKKGIAKKKPFTVNFRTLGGDPAPNILKELVVEFVHNGKPAGQSEGVRLIRPEQGCLLFGVQSGSYDFVSVM